MTFTDDDLKRLKEFHYSNLSSTYTIPEEWIEALLARLEASEVIAEDHASIYPNDPAVIKWRKACGHE